MSASTDFAARVFAYHERTKHHLNRYARALGYMDWATQPDPFRTYDGAPRFELSLTADDVQTRYCDLYVGGAVAPYRLGIAAAMRATGITLSPRPWRRKAPLRAGGMMRTSLSKAQAGKRG